MKNSLLFIFVIWFSPILSQGIPIDNIILSLNFDNESINDESIYSHNAIDNQTDFAAGINSTGLLLEGQNNYLEIEFETSLQINNEVTTSLWYQHAQQGGNSFYSLLEQSADIFGGHSRYGTWIFNQDQIMTCIEPDVCPNGNTLCQRCITFTDGLELGEWYHIVTSYDGSTLKIYLNGELVSEETFPEATGISILPYPLTIGTDIYDSNSIFLKGVLDEINLYNIALTDNQVESLYNQFDISSSTQELEKAAVSIYPNPTSDYLVIDSPTHFDQGYLFNTQGQLVQTISSTFGKAIKFNSIGKGIYFLKLVFENQVVTRRVVVE